LCFARMTRLQEPRRRRSPPGLPSGDPLSVPPTSILEQVEMVVLRLTADEVVMMAADWRSGEE
jgi:hypothetical protein